MIKCENVTIYAGKKTIVENVSFSVNKGEICVIIGKNGSGKTTLLRAIGKNVAFNGNIFADGQSIHDMSAKTMAKTVAYMPQTLPIAPISVKQLVAFGRQPYTGMGGILSAHDKRIVRNMLEKTGLDVLEKSRVDLISGGERRRAFFAMMLAQESPIILADEPTANLDAEYCKLILSMLTSLKAVQNTVITVLHDINDAFEIADKIVVLDNGRLIFCGTPENAAKCNIPQRIFGMKSFLCSDSSGNEKIIYK